VRGAARGAWRAAQAGLRPVSETPLNTEIGPHRRFDWLRLPLDEVRRIGRAAEDETGADWKDDGYWLVPIVALIVLLWSRRGWVIGMPGGGS